MIILKNIQIITKMKITISTNLDALAIPCECQNNLCPYVSRIRTLQMVSYRVSLYPPFPSNCLCCMAPSVIKNKGTTQMSSLEVLKRERKYNLSKCPNFQIRSSVQKTNPIYDSSIPCLNYHCIIVTEINIIVLYCKMDILVP